MTVKEILNKGIKDLKEMNIDEASFLARMLLCDVLKCRKEELIIRLEYEIKEGKRLEFLNGLDKLANGYPIQYLIHSKEFMKMDFYVDENVLIPRSDTEILVEEVIRICKEKGERDILELCTGSGIIAISLAKYIEDSNIIGVDISGRALEVAEKNAKRLLENQKIEFIKSDMFENIGGKFDVIVSNPPYIKTNVLDEYNLKFEPKLALDGGKDGLEFYNIIINEAYKYLKKDGIIALEIGFDQRREVENLVKNSGKYGEFYCLQDLGGNDRVIVIHSKY